jgi:hypothetical protein
MLGFAGLAFAAERTVLTEIEYVITTYPIAIGRANASEIKRLPPKRMYPKANTIPTNNSAMNKHMMIVKRLFLLI